jgi:hypothetical protein
MRARNIKPGIFSNEILGQADPIYTLLFEGLWCLADKAGRLEDRPLRIRAELFPYREGLNVNGYLTELEQWGFIRRYEAGGAKLIQVLNFTKHQSPHHTERQSQLPSIPDDYTLTVKPPLGLRGNPPDSLIPDSLIPDSSITPLPPASGGEAPKVAFTGRKPKKGSIDAFMATDMPREVIDAAIRLFAAWDKNDPDGREIHSAFPLMVTRMADIIAKHGPNLTVDVLEQGAMDYLAQQVKRRKAPQYYFGNEPPQGADKPLWRSYAEAAYMKRKLVAQATTPAPADPLLIDSEAPVYD